jgi:hypothetical protein
MQISQRVGVRPTRGLTGRIPRCRAAPPVRPISVMRHDNGSKPIAELCQEN